MRNKNKVILLSGFFLILPFLLKAQVKNSSSTSSPYSRYGIGVLSNYSLGREEAMGGIGFGVRNPFQINSGNPASYTSLDSLSFLSQIGFNSRFTEYKTESGTNGSNNVNFDYLAFSFPVKKWWATAFGVYPVSQKGYSLSRTDSVNKVYTSGNFNGTGTLSRVFWGNAFNLNKNLSVGFNAWYMFGNLVDQSYVYFPDDANAYDYLVSKTLHVRNIGITTGIQYQFRNKKKNIWTIGAVFEPKENIGIDYSTLEDRALFRGSTTQANVIDTLRDTVSVNHKLRFPMSYGIGFTYSIKDKVIVGADYYYQKWSNSANQEYFSEQMDVAQGAPASTVLTDRSRFSAGMEWTPDENSISSYWKRAHYRSGLFYEKSYLQINGEQVHGYGVTFGLGMPFPKSRSNLNLSAELGHLGSLNNNLLVENYVKLTVHIVLYDRWFMKRKFD